MRTSLAVSSAGQVWRFGIRAMTFSNRVPIPIFPGHVLYHVGYTTQSTFLFCRLCGLRSVFLLWGGSQVVGCQRWRPHGTHPLATQLRFPADHQRETIRSEHAQQTCEWRKNAAQRCILIRPSSSLLLLFLLLPLLLLHISVVVDVVIFSFDILFLNIGWWKGNDMLGRG